MADNLEKLEKALGDVSGLQADITKAIERGEKVLELDKSLADARAEIETVKAPLKASGETIPAIVEKRLTDIDRRLGRLNQPNGSASKEPEMSTEKSFGAQVTDWLEDPNVRDRARSGKGTSRVELKGGSLRSHVAAVNLLKSRNLPATDENVRKAILLSDVTNFAPVNRLPDVMPMHARRNFVQDLIPTRNLPIGSAWEYLEWMGLGMNTMLTATSISSSGTTATLTYTAHGARVGDRIYVKDSTDTDYNGFFTVVSVPTADTLTYTMAADPADDTADGTILWCNLSTWGAAASVAENALKPESGLPARTVTGVVELIAHLFRVTKQSLDDVVGLQTEINSMGIAGLQSLMEYKLLYGPGTSNTITGLLVAAGVQAYTQAVSGDVGRFRAARHMSTLLENVGAIPTGAIVNVNDWELFETSVGLDEHFILPGGAAGSEARLWRIPYVATRYIAPGTVLFGDFQNGAEIVEREAPQVSFADQDGDDFKYNRVAMRFEQRAGLAIKRPEFFAKLTLI